MKLQIAILLCCLWMTTFIETKTVFRRTDKIADKFKNVDLPPEEIDPNVAPPEPQKIETIEPQSISNTVTAAIDSIVEEVPTAIPIEVIDVDSNTVDAVDIESATIIPSSTIATVTETTIKNEIDENSLSRYCKCSDSHCDCCREFRLPLLPIVRGPGCARVAFLGNDKMSVSLKYGDITLATRTISGKRAKPICVGLPGGYSQFCGRVYGLSRAKDNFKACLGFELRADDEVEAALRVSCFKFGPNGLRVAESEPLPSEIKDDEDDEDDIFGFGADADDEEEEEEEEEDDYGEEEEEANDPDDTPTDADYGGFSLSTLLEELDDEEEKPNKITQIQTKNDTISVAAQKRQVQTKEDQVATTNNDIHISTADAPFVSNSNNNPNTAGTTKIKQTKLKKKKAASESDNDYAFDILTGLLEFFN